MKKNDISLLEKIWDCIQMLDPAPSEEERNITKKLESADLRLLDSLSDEQKELLQSYLDLLSELNSISERRAFAKGVKFATAYLDEAAEIT